MPSCFYGPDGATGIFDECPAGWADHPCKVKCADAKPSLADAKEAIDDAAAQIAKMDGDGDGRIGGSKKGARRRVKRAAGSK